MQSVSGWFLAVLRPLAFVNSHLLRIGRAIGIVAVALMVIAILIQVVYRYLLNNALPWPDEAARFGMLWMAGLMAPTAFRRGGFVAIDMFGQALPVFAGKLLTLFLLTISLVVLVISVQIGYAEVTGFGGKFATASLYVPGNLTFTEWIRVPRSWMMLSMFVGVILLTLVNIELILRNLISIIGGADRLPAIPDANMAGAD
ncbi:MAG: TRAP transporter small permease [Roseibium sp.]|nr:TRAP transporter small permease [Roseibium sp.]